VIEHIGVVDFGGGEECRRGEFVSLLAAILNMQPVMHVMLKGQMIRHELVVDHDETDRHRLRWWGGCACECADGEEQAEFGEVSIHGSMPRYRGAAVKLHVPHQHQNDRDHQGGDDGADMEDVDIGQNRGLALHQLTDKPHRLVVRIAG